MESGVKEQLKEILAPYQGRPGVLIQVLQKVQERLGYLPEDAMEEVARVSGVSPNTAFGVVSFYKQFRATPIGRKQVMVCQGTACHVRGAPRILEAVERELGIKKGETTPDLEYGLETVACIGACGLAPTMRINKDTYGRLTTKKVAETFGHQEKKG